MSETNQNLDDIIIEEDQVESTAEGFEEVALDFESLDLSASDIVRIEGSKYASWSGVSGCNHQSTVDSNAKNAMDAWVKDQMYQHRNWRWVRYGRGVSHFSCSSRRDTWTGVRSCGCRGSVPCFIEFRKP